MAKGSYGRLPFSEQIEFFRRKMPLPSESWTQLYEAGHDQGFVVAGATRDALVTDFMKSIDQVIAEGKSLESFRRDFDNIVQTHGWDHNGSRNWRSKTIYETNLLTSFAAGRRQQMLDMTDTHPYWQYVHSHTSETPRPEHLALHGLILRWDDPFWQTHYPPNGWGCQCEVRALSARQIGKLGKNGPDASPRLRMRDVIIGKDGPTPRSVRVPAGIDPGFEYAPGATLNDHWLARRAGAAMKQAPDIDNRSWQPVITKTPGQLGRPAQIPLFSPPKPSHPQPAASVVSQITDALGAPTRTFDVRGVPVTVNASALGKQLAKESRAEHLPVLTDLLTDPWEVWTNLYRDPRTGAYALRTHILKGYRVKGRGVVAVVQAGAGFFESWMLIPAGDAAALHKRRLGNLLHSMSTKKGTL